MKVLNLEDVRHSVRVAGMCLLIGELLDLEKKYLDSLYLACLFHDIGKAHTDQSVLNKRSVLNVFEKEHLKEHPVYSCREMKALGYPKEITDIILHHHENYDGTGYPKGLKGNSIPIGSRILKVADVFDALTMERPYRKRLSQKEAIRIMENEKEHYDPDVYKMFLSFLTFRYKKLKDSAGGCRLSQDEINRLVSMVEWSHYHEVSPIHPDDYDSIRTMAKSSLSVDDIQNVFYKHNHG